MTEETHPAGTDDLVNRLRSYQEFEQNRDGQIVCVESEIANEAANHIEQLVATVEQLEAALTRANAAAAAAYEVAAKSLDAVADQWSCGHPARYCDCARDVEQWRFASDEVRALATPDQTAALDKLIAEAVADKDDEISRLNQNLGDMRDNVEIAYYRGYWAGGNGE